MKLSGPEQVTQYMNNLEHPIKEAVEKVRRIILGANNGISENIKWNAPNFCYENEDRITFNLQGKGMLRLIFHRGAKVKENKASEHLFQDTTGLLEWVANDRAIVKISDLNDAIAKREKLAELVIRWIEGTSGV